MLKKASQICRNLYIKGKIVLISESANWVILNICKSLVKNLNKRISGIASLSYTHIGLRNKILHFGSLNTFVKHHKIVKIHKSNKIILTIYHLVNNDPREALIPQINNKVNYLITASQMNKRRLISLGISAQKIIVISEGVDLQNFRKFSARKKSEIKKRLKIPAGKIIIGSFQKDGNGWGEGLTPKLIKGPDIFCDVVTELAKKYDIHVFLTGPSRGYVKKRLEKANISYTHKYPENYLKLVEYYNILDLYLVTSRIEGGPQAVLETMATGTPLISTRVGLAPDIIRNGKNGMLAEVENTREIIKKAGLIIENSDLRKKIISQALTDIQKYDYEIIVKKYFLQAYEKLLQKK